MLYNLSKYLINHCIYQHWYKKRRS